MNRKQNTNSIMLQHSAVICWKRTGPNFAKGQYSREYIAQSVKTHIIVKEPTP